MDEHQSKYVCHRCVRDTYLATQLLHAGQTRLCSYCGERRQTFPLEEMAARIHEVVQQHFRLTPNYPDDPDGWYAVRFEHEWERRGCSPNDIIAEIAGLEQDIADDIVQHLSDIHSYGMVRHGDEDPYGLEARYEECGPDAGPFRIIWDNVPTSIQHQVRFFNTEAESALNRVFRELDTLSTAAADSVFEVIGNDGDTTVIWRARRAGSRSQLQKILANPTSEMGPPPPAITPAGRMNSAGIPVFYGALDQDTAIAEIRPPVGSYVVTGKFELLKPVSLLNLSLLQDIILQDIIVEKRYFEPDYAERANRVAFLKQLAQELTKPVMPEDEPTEYTATQVIAEYLAHKAQIKLDGISFRSAQTDPPGQNIVLFNHSSSVESYPVPPRNDVVVGIHNRYDDYGHPKGSRLVAIWEFTEPEPPEDAPRAEDPDQPDTSPEPPRPYPTLRLDVHGLAVHEIKAMKPDYESMETFRYRDSTSQPQF